MSESRIDPERWPLVKRLVADAVGLPPAERERFLAGECAADALLRHEVDVLLASHDAAGDMFENRPWPVADLAHAGVFTFGTGVELEPGRRLGPSRNRRGHRRRRHGRGVPRAGRPP